MSQLGDTIQLHSLIRIINKSIVKFTLSKADLVFATSNFLAQKTNRFTNKDVIITPFGVDIEKFSPKSLIKKKINKFIFGTIKALYPKYGIKYLIEAAKIIDKQISDWELWICGTGTEEKFLKELSKKLGLEEKVKFFGKIAHEKVPLMLQKMDVFVVPSVWECESFGVAAVEAAACGKPVIASRIGGLPEVVVDNSTGFLVKPKNPKEIADKIIYLYKNRTECENMSNSARNFVLENYNWSENAEIMLKKYKEFLS